MCSSPSGCAQSVGPEWKRLSYEIPTGLRPTDKMLFQTSTPISGGNVLQLRIDDDDPDEALEVLDEIADELRTHSAYLCTLGAALLGADRTEEAVEVLERAAASEPDDPEYTYQLAVALDAAGHQEKSVQKMLRVLELDTRDAGGLEEPSAADVDTLKSTMEDVLEDLPDPLLKLVASAPIIVQARATEEQVKKGVNP